MAHDLSRALGAQSHGWREHAREVSAVADLACARAGGAPFEGPLVTPADDADLLIDRALISLAMACEPGAARSYASLLAYRHGVPLSRGADPIRQSALRALARWGSVARVGCSVADAVERADEARGAWRALRRGAKVPCVTSRSEKRAIRAAVHRAERLASADPVTPVDPFAGPLRELAARKAERVALLAWLALAGDLPT